MIRRGRSFEAARFVRLLLIPTRAFFDVAAGLVVRAAYRFTWSLR